MFSTPKDLCKQELKEFIGHKDEVNCVSYSSDFKFMVTGSDDQRVRVFKVVTKQCLIKLKGHEGAVKAVSVSPCDKYFASGSFDKTIRVWRTANGTCWHVLKGHTKSVETVTFSPGSIYVCSGSWDRTAKLWSVQTGCLIWTLTGHSSLVQSLGFSKDCTMLATGSWDYTVRIWRLDHEAYSQIVLLDLKEREVTSNDEITDTDNGEELVLKDEYSEEVKKDVKTVTDDYCDTSKDIPDCQKTEVSEADDDSKNKKESEIEDDVLVLHGHTGNVHAVVFSKIGMLATGSWDRTIRLWNPWNGKCLRILEGHEGWVKAVSFSSDATYVASAADDDSVKVWDIPSGSCINTLEGDTDLAQHCAFTSDGQLIASGAAVNNTKPIPTKPPAVDEEQLVAIMNQ